MTTSTEVTQDTIFINNNNRNIYNKRTPNSLPSRPPLAQLFNADLASFTDEMPQLEDDKRRHVRRRPSRADALHLNSNRRPSVASSSHSRTTDENFNSSNPNLNLNNPSSLIPLTVLPPTTQPNLYDNLATFSFGSPSSVTPAPNNSRAVIAPWENADDDNPSNRDNNNNDDDDNDDDNDSDPERARDERAKMRAIDDGTRRPSLPTNLATEEIMEQRRPSQPINIPRPPPKNDVSQGHSQGENALNSFEMDLSPMSSWPHSGRTPPAHIHPLARAISEADSPPPMSVPDDDDDDNVTDERSLENANNNNNNNNALEGFDLSFILAPPPGTSNGSPLPNGLQTPRLSVPPPPTSTSHNFHFPFTSRDARRPSTISMLSDGQSDTFFRHINKNDTEYGTRRKVWSFRRRETAKPKERVAEGQVLGAGTASNGSSAENRRGQSQLWECYAVGKFSVSRCRSAKDETSDKPPPQRLLVRPYNSHHSSQTLTPTAQSHSHLSHTSSPQRSHHASERPLHPTALIHKHSRANAFSIFRASKLRGQHMSASQCVLLAPLKVQVHYTETRSTRALMTHGTLEADAGMGSFGSVRGRGSSFGDGPAGQAAAGNNSRSQTSSGGSTTSSGTLNAAEMASSPKRPPLNVSTTNSPGISSTSVLSSNLSSSTLIASSANRSYVHHTARMHAGNSLSPQTRSPISPLQEEESDSFDERDPHHTAYHHRKSHADAFAMLDERQLEGFRMAHPNGHVGHGHGHEVVPVPVEVARVRQSRFGTALKRAFAVTPPVNGPGDISFGLDGRPNGHSHSQQGPNGVEPNGIYNPPWLTLPPRAQQEKNERTLHQLNKSFEDVGLLPHRKKASHSHSSSGHGHGSSGSNSSNSNLLKRAFTTKSAGTVSTGGGGGGTHSSQSSHGGEGNGANGDAFEEVPDTSPVMLLPMWASDDATAGDKGKMSWSSVNLPLNERRYLLIYYVPFAAEKKSNNGKGDRKRARQPRESYDERTSSDSHKDRERDNVLSAFRVVAKVLSYDDVRMSGLRLPNEGIEVSPSPSPTSPGYSSLSHNMPLPLSNFGDTMVIAICPSPESGIEFVPEGLDKLGLCYRLTNDQLPISSIAEPAERERLSPVGRAIVEMAWCGCLSVMGLATTL